MVRPHPREHRPDARPATRLGPADLDRPPCTSTTIATTTLPGQHDPGLESVVSSDALGRAINRLTIDQRSILALHHLEERPVAKIAAVLGIPVGTAKWRLHAARQALERALEAER